MSKQLFSVGRSARNEAFVADAETSCLQTADRRTGETAGMTDTSFCKQRLTHGWLQVCQFINILLRVIIFILTTITHI